MLNRRSFQIYSFFLIALLLSACSNQKKVDVSNIDISINIERFDKEMDRLTPENLPIEAPKLKREFGYFYEDYMSGMLGVGGTADTSYYNNLRMVLEDQDYQELKTAVKQKFPDLQKAQNELTDAFKHVIYYYPDQKLPRLIAFFSGFAVQTPVGNDYIGIGLDMFLGADSKFYPALRHSIPQYISRRFTPENITPRVIEAFVRENMFPERDEDLTFLSKIVYNGKILYLMDALMPDVADSLKIGYTTEQLQWCRKYEADIWGYFLQESLLFETDYMKYQKYISEAPFTPGIGERNESAPKLGIFTGWQIVKKFMEKNSGTSLQGLMEETDAQKILNLSGYKPKQK